MTRCWGRAPNAEPRHGSDGSGSRVCGGGSVRAAALAVEAECRLGSGGSATALTETGGTLVTAAAELDSGHGGSFSRGGRRCSDDLANPPPLYI